MAAFLEIPEKKGEAFTGNSTKLGDNQKFQGQKPRPMEIPYDSFLNIPAISTSVIVDPWNLQFLLSTGVSWRQYSSCLQQFAC